MSRELETQKFVDEHTVQRYIFEELNYGDKDTLKNFYPDSVLKELGGKQIKVIIPNYPLGSIVKDGKNIPEHITDFRIIYTDDTYHNIEVEWTTTNFKSHGKEVYDKYYKDGNGFLIVLEDDSIGKLKFDYIDKKYIKQIEAEAFAHWFTFKSKYLVDNTISYYVPHYDSGTRKHWVIYLSATGEKNSLFHYKEEGRKYGKWAFKHTNKGEYMKSILNICKGDIVIFIWELTMLGEIKQKAHQRRATILNDWYINGIEIANVKKGYSCDFNDEIFESENWKLNKITEKKEYMHYFRFDKNFLYSSEMNKKLFPTIDKIFYKDERLGINGRVPELKGVIDAFVLSLNCQGTPVEITLKEYNNLLSYLGSLR